MLARLVGKAASGYACNITDYEPDHPAWLRFVFVETTGHAEEGIYCTVLLHGEGPLGELGECRHTYGGGMAIAIVPMLKIFGQRWPGLRSKAMYCKHQTPCMRRSIDDARRRLERRRSLP